MPARDLYHGAIRNALVKDGWTITDDPLHIKCGKKNMFVALGAERGQEKIAVEIKGFGNSCEMRSLQFALGQSLIYGAVLAQQEPNRVFYLAVPQNVMAIFFHGQLSQLLMDDVGVHVIAFDPSEQKVVAWMSPPSPSRERVEV